jgi:hypothetical protein
MFAETSYGSMTSIEKPGNFARAPFISSMLAHTFRDGFCKKALIFGGIG